MPQTAIIYTRVSTDEQATGYSLSDQEDKLRNYCLKRDIEVIAHYQDDHSAKSFDRPEYKKLMEFARRNKNKVDLMLFINWSRFSRNAGDAYGMISRLSKMEIIAQAIDQPLDLTIPEQKMMLAIYLATPEIENDRRSLNIRGGIRRAKKQGRYTSKAPFGYYNSRDEANKPILRVKEEEAAIVIKAYEMIAAKTYSIIEVFRMLKSEGLHISKNQFHRMIRNRLYLGYTHIKATKDEPEEWVKGLHESIISEELFLRVQEAINGKTIIHKHSRNGNSDHLPLRGHLQCCECGSSLTGSGSKGNGGRYFYYHCRNGCKARYKADEVHKAFNELLSGIKIDEGAKALYTQIIKFQLKECADDGAGKMSNLQKQKQQLQERLNKLQDMLMDGTIEPEDYSSMKCRYKDDLTRTDIEIARLKSFTIEAKEQLEWAVEYLSNIDRFYLKAPSDVKKKILGSTFTGKLIYDGKKCRTTEINKGLELIMLNVKELQNEKMGSHSNAALKSHLVELAGVEPASKQGI